MKSTTNISRRAFLLGRAFCNDQQGATAVEYGLLASLIGAGNITGMTKLRNRTRRKFNCSTRALKGKSLPAGCE
ncbi:MAG: Flp family type IVb pilin [Notoacmeibacter sp.]|nr:Flp family type IVb pilin [Notoacmeibacter sp.]MCC0031738.1 Flp family type IVb pilin [Brucellaceae bacterium]